MKHVYVLFGGIWSWDGFATSAGMYALVNDLRDPNTTVKSYAWADWLSAFRDQNREVGPGDKMIGIGYSGGGPYCTILAERMARSKENMDLMVLYDPSPQQWMVPVGRNVKKAVCYQNTSPTWFIYPLGGAKLEATLDGPEIEVWPISKNHVAVQFDQRLHQKTIEFVRSL